jgi:hypothetical protein
MRWLLTPTAENSWRFVLWIMVAGFALRVIALAGLAVIG